MRKSVVLGAVAALALIGMGTPASAQDAAAGEKAFKKFCSVCHTVEAGKNRVGPSLHDIVGRAAGAVSSFSYSSAMKGSGITWSDDKLDTYLADPKATVPGNKMTFAGVKDAAERANIVAYLKTAK